jgi:glycerol-3-phosphate dehydrogenase
VNPQVVAGLYCAGAGIASPYEMAIALAENAAANGVKIHLNSRVTNLEFSPQGKQPQIAVTLGQSDTGDTPENPRRLTTRFVINAAGLFAHEIARLAGDESFTITPRKGEYVLFAKDTGRVVNQVLFQMPTRRGKGVLVTSTYHGNLMIGPDSQTDTQPGDRNTEVQSIRQILERAHLTTDAFDLKQFIRSFAGVRAISSTGDFIIRPSAVHPQLIHVAGIQSPGLTASPAIAQRVVEILADQGLAVGSAASRGDFNAGFNPHRAAIIRPKSMTMKQAMELTKLEPGNPQRIVCRCEQVSEAEILDALSRWVPVLSTDAVKRRTRAGMGWCQGSFCRPRVVELLESHTGIRVPPAEDIEHSGTNRVQKEDLLS